MTIPKSSPIIQYEQNSSMKLLHQFLKKTQLVSVMIGIAILLIIVVNWLSPTNLKISVLIKLIIMALISYSFYLNYTETAKIVKNAPELIDNTRKNYTGFRTNIILSYALCGFLFGLFLYIAYSFVI